MPTEDHFNHRSVDNYFEAAQWGCGARFIPKKTKEWGTIFSEQ
jgi:hypothetical protein